MKNLIKLFIVLFLCKLSLTLSAQAVMDEYLLKKRAYELEAWNSSPADKRSPNALAAFRLSAEGWETYWSYWYQLITAAGMEDYYSSPDFIINFYVLDESFEKLPDELRKKMTDPNNKEKIQKFLKHYLCISKPYETFVDFAMVGNIKNLHSQNINIQYQVGPMPENDKRQHLSDILILKATANGVKLGLHGRQQKRIDVMLMDFFPGTLDYFK
jgi:hypothetical protein